MFMFTGEDNESNVLVYMSVPACSKSNQVGVFGTPALLFPLVLTITDGCSDSTDVLAVY